MLIFLLLWQFYIVQLIGKVLIEYCFEYVSRDKNGAFLKINRKNDFIWNGEIDDNIYVYSVDHTYDYVLVNKQKPDEVLVPFVILIGMYDVGDNNEAQIYVHSSLKNFEGYVKAYPYWQPTTSEGMHIISITLH